MVSRDTKPDNTVVRFAGTDATFGGKGLAIIAGPCSVESREQTFAVAERVAQAGAQFFAAELTSRAPHLMHSRG
jgi:3-deoxy-7-phosphoheptulonate synthase